MAQIDIKRATITIMDGTATPKTVAIKVGEGNLTFSEKRNIQYIKDRGLIDGTREGDEEPMDLDINCRWDSYLSNGSENITPVEAVKGIGAAATASWVTTGPACEPYAVDIKISYDAGCASTVDETITFPDFRYESIDFDLRAGTLSIKGKCNAKQPTVLRTFVA